MSAETAVETLFPTTKGKISAVKSLSSFKTSEGYLMYGIEVSTINGDTFSVWNPSEEILAQFKEGVTFTYTKKLVKKGEKEAFRLADYSFPIPRSERFEPMLVPKIADAITYAASYAKDICVAEGHGMADFESYAERIYSWMKQKLLNETFEDAGK